MKRDPGLQPERTSLSWLRTQLVLFGVGLAEVVLLDIHGLSWLALIAIFSVTLALIGSGYFHYRFSGFFRHSQAVAAQEYWVKMAVSAIVGILAACYWVFMLLEHIF